MDDNSKDDKSKHDTGEVVGGVLLVPLAFAWSATSWVRPRAHGRRTRRWLRRQRRAR